MSGSDNVQALLATVRQMQEQKYELERKINSDKLRMQMMEGEMEESVARLRTVTDRKETKLCELAAVKARVTAQQERFESIQRKTQHIQDRVKKVMMNVDKEMKGRTADLEKYEMEMGKLCDCLHQEVILSSHARLADRMETLLIEERNLDEGLLGKQQMEVDNGSEVVEEQLEDWLDLVEKCKWLEEEIIGQKNEMKKREVKVREEISEMVTANSRKMMSNN